MASYPGTPATEILPAVLSFRREEDAEIYIEWSVNEKVAYEVALAAAYAGKRAAVAMKQVGLNVASDPLFSSVYTGVKGGFVVVAADDPGPHSSQTEQDSRLWGLMAKIPVLDPSTPQEAKDMAAWAFELSERYEIPVLLRPTLRICHARQTVTFGPIRAKGERASFIKDPNRWAATPRHRFRLHEALNRKLEAMAQELETASFNYVLGPFDPSREFPLGIVAGGAAFGTIKEVLEDLGVADEVPLLKVGAPWPYPRGLVDGFVSSCRRVLVLEEPDSFLELLITERKKVLGRFNGFVPRAGELLPEVVEETLRRAWSDAGVRKPLPPKPKEIPCPTEAPQRPPTLCAGCPHRASFYAIKRVFPQAIFTSDIGCYTLGLNQGAVDIVLDMGAAITMATGLWHAYRQDGQGVPIVATIGDSTFFHAGLPGLLDAVHTGASFVLVLLDNSTTAMTGMQPTPASATLADGSEGRPLSPEDLIRACGVEFIEVVDPYEIPRMMEALRRAERQTRQHGGVAAVIARHPCFQLIKRMEHPRRVEVELLEEPPQKEALKPVYVKKTPPCNLACPAGNDVEGVLALVARGEVDGAVKLLLQGNPLPSVCGRVCFHPCEEACNRGRWDEAVSIQAIERLLGDRATVDHLPQPLPDSGFKVAVVGSGPAGLSCAYSLRLLGHTVEVFEALPEPGGLLRYGIPPYRLPKDVLNREIERLKSLGITIRTGARLGKELPWEELAAYDAIYLATGAHVPRPLGIPGEELQGVWRGLELLEAINRGESPELKGRIAVIGGGNTAIDVSRCLLRLGAEPLLLYRRGRADMPAHPSEVEEAEAEGVEMEFFLSPVEIVGPERVRAIRLQRMRPGPRSRDGRRTVEPVVGSDFSLEVDGVVIATGEVPEPVMLPEEIEAKAFRGGDLVGGPRTVAHAIGSGKKGALGIHRYLTGEERTREERSPQEVPFEVIDLSAFAPGNRPQAPHLSPREARKDFREVVGGISEEDAVREASERCFHCGSCTECDFCMLSCPEGAISKEDGAYRVDLSKCSLCRLCAVACPRGVIEMPLAGGCVSCGYCLQAFGCPALMMEDHGIRIDRKVCVDCGLCVFACHQGAIREG